MKKISITLLWAISISTIALGITASIPAGLVQAADAAVPSGNTSRNLAKNCSKIATRIGARSEAFGAAKADHMSAYDNMLTRLNRFDANIKAKGYDTKALEADIAILTAKIDEFSTLVEKSQDLIQATRSSACTIGRADLIVSLSQAKNKMRLTHQKALEIRNFYATVLRPDLMDLKTQNPGAVSNSESNNNEAEATSAE